MANFDIVKLKNSPYDYLLIATSYRSSLSDVLELDSVVDLGKGKVLFDFLLIHGNKKNRFVECVVIDDSCERNSIKVPNDIDENIRQQSSNFFKKNQQLIKNSILPKSLQYLIVNGDIL